MKAAKQSKKKAPDLDKYFEVLKDRSLQRLDYLYKKYYEQAQNKEAFINICITKVRAQYIFFTSDMYMNNMVEIFKEKLNLRRPMWEIVDEVQKARIIWKQQQDFGIEYRQHYEPVYYFVNDERDEKIVKWLVTYAVALLFKVNVLDVELKKLKSPAVNNTTEKTKKTKPAKATKNQKQKILSFQWQDKKHTVAQITSLYQWLLDNKLILKTETTLTAFKAVFGNKEIEKPIIWHGEVGELAYLLDELAKRFFVVPDQIKPIIKSKELSTKDKKAFSKWLNPKFQICFIDSRRKPISRDSIKHAKNFYQNKRAGDKKPGKGKQIDKFIRALVKVK